MNAYSKTALATAIAAALTACSSGSTSNDDSTPNSNNGNNQPEEVQVERVSLTGLAIKGNVRNAKVEMFRVINDQKEDNAFVSGSTDNNGRYNLLGISETAYDGPAIIEISHQANARMLCDSSTGCEGTQQSSDDANGNNEIDFGEWFDLPTNFLMTAAVPRINTSAFGEQTFTANVTSLTHISSQYAEDQGINETNIRGANNRVRLMFGLGGDVDLVITEPTDVTSGNTADDEQTRYGALTAALAQIAEARNQTVADVLATFAQNYIQNNGQLRWNEKSGTNQQIDIEEILAAARLIANSIGENDLGNELQSAVDEANSMPAEGISDFNPPIALPGANQEVIAGEQVTLTGTADIPDGVTVNYQWQQLSGTPVTLTNANSQQASFVAPTVPGELIFTFRVTDTSNAINEDTARTRVLVNARPGQNEAVAGQYVLFGSTLGYSLGNPAGNDRILEYDVGTEISTRLTFDPKTDSSSELLLRINGVYNEWYAEQEYNSQSFPGSNKPKSMISDNLSRPEAEADTGTLLARLNDKGTIFVQQPDEVDLEENENDEPFEAEVEFGRDLPLYRVAPGTYMSNTTLSGGVFDLTADNRPDYNRTPRAIDLTADSIILSTATAGFSANRVADEYGVISIELASDEAYGHGLSSELQTWEISDKSSDNFSFKRTGDNVTEAASAAPYGRLTSIYTSEIRFDDDNDVYIEAGQMANQLNNKLEEATADSSVTPASLRNNSPLFNQPLVNDLVADGLTATFQGITSGNGELISTSLMSAGSLGGYDGDSDGTISESETVKTWAINRSFGIEVNDRTPVLADVSNKEYRMQGIEYVLGSNGQISANVLNGILRFNAIGEPQAVVDNDEILLLNRRNGNDTSEYNLARRIETYVSPAAGTTAANGDEPLEISFAAGSRVVLQDNETVLEGFISPDSKRMMLRIISKSNANEGPVSDDARHGYVMISLIEDQNG